MRAKAITSSALLTALQSETFEVAETSHHQALAQLSRNDEEPILSTTLRCLELLDYPRQYIEQREEDVESFMAPFQILAHVCAKQTR